MVPESLSGEGRTNQAWKQGTDSGEPIAAARKRDLRTWAQVGTSIDSYAHTSLSQFVVFKLK